MIQGICERHIKSLAEKLMECYYAELYECEDYDEFINNIQKNINSGYITNKVLDEINKYFVRIEKYNINLHEVERLTNVFCHIIHMKLYNLKKLKYKDITLRTIHHDKFLDDLKNELIDISIVEFLKSIPNNSIGEYYETIEIPKEIYTDYNYDLFDIL